MEKDKQQGVSKGNVFLSKKHKRTKKSYLACFRKHQTLQHSRESVNVQSDSATADCDSLFCQQEVPTHSRNVTETSCPLQDYSSDLDLLSFQRPKATFVGTVGGQPIDDGKYFTDLSVPKIQVSSREETSGSLRQSVDTSTRTDKLTIVTTSTQNESSFQIPSHDKNYFADVVGPPLGFSTPVKSSHLQDQNSLKGLETPPRQIYHSGTLRTLSPILDKTPSERSPSPNRDGNAIAVQNKVRDFNDTVSTLPSLIVENVRPVGYDKSLTSLTGNRIVNIAHVVEAARRLEAHECPVLEKPGYLSFTREIRHGFASDLIFECTSCTEKRVISTHGEAKPDEINLAATWGTVSIGRGHYHLQELMSVMDIPTPSFQTYKKYEDDVGKAWLDSLVFAMEAAIAEEKRLAIEAGDVDTDGVPWITVILDGGWSHRSYGHSYTANSGVAVIIGRRTKKILFLGVRQKYCSICALATSGGNEIPSHECFKNWDKSSPAMEADIIVEGFRMSESQHQLRYLRFVADGDSSVYKKIKEQVPYERSVTKVECANHLVKNVTKKLHKLADENASTRKILKGRVKDMGGHSRRLVTVNAADENPSVPQLKKDLLNVPRHSFGDHTHCRAGVCSNAGHVFGEGYAVVPKYMQLRIEGIMNALVTHAHSLINNDTSNLAEAVMHVVAKFNGGKQVFYGQRASFITRSNGAALSFQHGHNWHAVAWKRKVGHSPGGVMKGMIKRRVNKKVAARNIMKKYRHQYKTITHSKNPDYGNSCQKPDLPDAEVEEAGLRIIALLAVNKEEQTKIEFETRGQAENPRWFQERRQRLTASNFGAVARRRAPPGPLVKQILYSVHFSSAATEWGKQHETIAVKAYEEVTGTKVEPCGLFVDIEKGFLAASPDGLVGEEKIIEVKCPYSARNMTPFQAAKELKRFYCTAGDNGTLTLKKNENYYYQIQGQLRISNRKRCDFIVWTPLGISIETIERDDNFIRVMVEKLEKFYTSAMLPEIVDPRVARSMQVRGTVAPKAAKSHQQIGRKYDCVNTNE